MFHFALSLFQIQTIRIAILTTHITSQYNLLMLIRLHNQNIVPKLVILIADIGNEVVVVCKNMDITKLYSKTREEGKNNKSEENFES